MPLYPGTGAPSETGEHGTILNAPMEPGDGSVVFRDLMERVVLPRMEAFRPDLLIVSAGFDAHWRDPLASINLTETDFGWATQRVMTLADKACGSRVVSVLEGGYDLEALAKSASAHLDALMGREVKA
jgi:acetoin utilization deacetylase AcuC-like enzyme